MCELFVAVLDRWYRLHTERLFRYLIILQPKAKWERHVKKNSTRRDNLLLKIILYKYYIEYYLEYYIILEHYDTKQN